jgi:hypothetical protein
MSEAEQRKDFLKWMAWASTNTMLFTRVSTDGGKTWGCQSDPSTVAWEAWQAAVEKGKVK